MKCEFVLASTRSEIRWRSRLQTTVSRSTEAPGMLLRPFNSVSPQYLGPGEPKTSRVRERCGCRPFHTIADTLPGAGTPNDRCGAFRACRRAFFDAAKVLHACNTSFVEWALEGAKC